MVSQLQPGEKILSDPAGKRSLSTLTLIIDVVWWLSLVAIVLGGALVVLVATHAIRASVLSFEFYFQPRGADYRVLTRSLGGSAAQIRDASGQLSFARPPMPFVLAGAAVLAVAAGWWLVIVDQLRRLLRSVRAGATFAPDNAARLQRIGAAVIGFVLLRSVVVWGGSLYLQHMVAARGLSVRSHFGLDVPVILLGLLLLVLAAAFRVGAELQEDHDLTI